MSDASDEKVWNSCTWHLVVSKQHRTIRTTLRYLWMNFAYLVLNNCIPKVHA